MQALNCIAMTVYKFKKLDGVDQYITIWEHGVLLGQRKEANYKILLFQIFSFYVEAYYNEQEKRLENLRPFKSTAQLKSYLQEIDITDIYLSRPKKKKGL